MGKGDTICIILAFDLGFDYRRIMALFPIENWGEYGGFSPWDRIWPI
jgi:hypothetical protein